MYKPLLSLLLCASIAGAQSIEVITPTGRKVVPLSGDTTISSTGAVTVNSVSSGLQPQLYQPRNSQFSTMGLRRTIATLTGVSSGISGVTYNGRSNTLFLVRNVSGAAGTIYEVTLDGTLLRTITNSNFIDTEAVEWVGSIKGAGTSTVYDVLLVAEEDHTTAANEAQITLCLLTAAATTLDRTAVNSTDPDNVTVTTAYSGGTIGNSGLESVCYDSRRSTIYYTSEFQNGATVSSTGTTQAHIYTRSITWSPSALSFGAESTLCDINALYATALGAGGLGDISDMSYSALDDTIILQGDVGDRALKISRAGALLETLTTTGGQPEGGALSPDGRTYWMVGEAQEFYRYAVGPDFDPTRRLVQTATLDFASTLATAVSDLTVTVTDAAVGDPAMVSPLSAPTTTATLTAWVSAANTVTVRFSPKATEDPASAVYRVMVFKN